MGPCGLSAHRFQRRPEDESEARVEVGDPEMHAFAGIGAPPPGVAGEHPQVRCSAVCESAAARQRGAAFLCPVWRPAKDPGVQDGSWFEDARLHRRDQQPLPGGYRQLLLAELRRGPAQEAGGVDARRSSCRTKCVRGPGFSFPASTADPRIPGRARADGRVLFVRVWAWLAERHNLFPSFPQWQWRPSEPNCQTGTVECTGERYKSRALAARPRTFYDRKLTSVQPAVPRAAQLAVQPAVRPAVQPAVQLDLRISRVRWCVA